MPLPNRMVPNRLHDRLYSLATLAVLAAIAIVAAGCSSRPTGVANLAGRYELRSVDGRSLPDQRLGGAISGELVLTTRGRATRVVQHATSGIPGPIIRRATGTYRRRGAEITLILVKDGMVIPEATWRVTGEVQSPFIVLRYPGPADRMIEERYVRVASSG